MKISIKLVAVDQLAVCLIDLRILEKEINDSNGTP